MKEKPYRIVGSAAFTKCVCKVFYGGRKFVVVKCKDSMQSLKRIENSLNAFIRGGVNDKNGLYFHLFNYVQQNPNKKFKVQYLFESENGYELLKKEQEELDKNKHNPSCLNNQIEAYVPNYNEETEMYGWITKQEVLNFRKWQKHRPKPQNIKS
jgi:hypothetical protein